MNRVSASCLSLRAPFFFLHWQPNKYRETSTNLKPNSLHPILHHTPKPTYQKYIIQIPIQQHQTILNTLSALPQSHSTSIHTTYTPSSRLYNPTPSPAVSSSTANHYYPTQSTKIPSPRSILKKPNTMTGIRYSPSHKRNVAFAPLDTFSRSPYDDETLVMRAFTKHCSHCSRCANPYESYRRYGSTQLCSKGRQRALDVSQYLLNKSGHAFSVVDLDKGVRMQVEIPSDCTVVRELLRAVERGMDVSRPTPSSRSYRPSTPEYEEDVAYASSPSSTTSSRYAFPPAQEMPRSTYSTTAGYSKYAQAPTSTSYAYRPKRSSTYYTVAPGSSGARPVPSRSSRYATYYNDEDYYYR